MRAVITQGPLGTAASGELGASTGANRVALQWLSRGAENQARVDEPRKTKEDDEAAGMGPEPAGGEAVT